MSKNILIFLALAAFSGCATYRENPIVLQENSAEWERVSAQFSGTIEPDEAKKIGLLLNTELNKMRARLAMSDAVLQESGFWNDPALSLGITQIYDPVRQTNFAPELSFTIPITGLPALEKEVAAHYREADYWSLAQAETDFCENLENALADFCATKSKRLAAQSRLAALRDEASKADALAQNGEISPATQEVICARLSAIAADLRTFLSQEYSQKLALLNLLGLHPSLADSVEFSTETGAETVPASVPAPSLESLLALPKVRAQLATYAASETELKTEIRKQFPELNISPGFERDGDETEMFSLGLGIDLPLWNRNRRAIAAAEGERNVRRIETIQIWREQVFSVRELDARQKIVRAHCLDEAVRAQERKKSAGTLSRSLALGETDFADASEAAQEAYSAQLSFIDSILELRKIQARLKALTPRNH